MSVKEIENIIKEGYKDNVSLQEIEHFEKGLAIIKMLENLQNKNKLG